jgi:histidinol dehydrogenase
MIRKFDIKSDECKAYIEKLTSRSELETGTQLAAVKSILKDVRESGDEAVFSYTKRFDGADIDSNNIEVTKAEIDQALSEIDTGMIAILQKAADNIRQFHSLQLNDEKVMRDEKGSVTLRFLPVDRAGVYVPGGRAAYPSSVLMNVMPAKVAGVPEIIMCTPPDENGKIYNMTLAAASIAGVDRIFKIGGAQAVGAMAYGTDSVPKVNKIVGPGNIYVALAKKEVYGTVGIDMIAGPSEVLIIADDTANPLYVASDLLSQAEHDPLAAPILLCTDTEFADKVRCEIEKILETLPTEPVARESVDNMGAIIVCDNLDEAVALSNDIAPEHLEIATADPDKLLDEIRNAGSVFLGEYSPEPLGDYFAGANHVLPTSGNAKFASPLGTYDFIKKQSVIKYTKQGLKQVANEIDTFAKGEGLYAHANSITVRFEDE